MKISGIAPEFVGRFEKAIDYIVDLKEFEESFKKHVSIADATSTSSTNMREETRSSISKILLLFDETFQFQEIFPYPERRNEDE